MPSQHSMNSTIHTLRQWSFTTKLIPVVWSLNYVVAY